ncbi:bifunctional 3-(3-hydroxy-phenyl)propionate/3-hydroxycinnamic acid hydroxylase [Streptomyces sp. NPDC002577]
MVDTTSTAGHTGRDLTDGVLVVGAGPAGLTLANYLGGFGVNVLVVEANEELIDFPRGVGMDDECLRSFQAVGLVDQVLPHVTPNQIQRFVNGDGKLLAEIAPRTDEFGWPRKNAFIQPLVDRELYSGLDRFPHAEVLFGHRMTGYTEHDDCVEVALEGPGGAPLTVRAAYLVGTDGGRSLTRHTMGVAFEGHSSPSRWLVVDIRNDPIGTPNAYMGADPTRPYVSIGLPHGIRRFEFMLLDKESEEEAAEPAFLHRLLAPHVADPAGLDYIRHRVYTHHARLAGSFRKRRVMIAGDAAHLMPVWQGQGYNSCIRDSTNLGWKLAMVVKGIAGDALLDSYDSERRDHAAGMIKISVVAGRVISPTNKAVARLRDLAAAGLNFFPAAKSYFTQMRFKPMPRYTTGAVVGAADATENSPVGRLLIQPRVDTEHAKNVRLDEVLGPWFAVVSWGNDPAAVLDADAAAVLRRIRARLVQVVPASQVAEARARQPEGSQVVIVGDRTGALKRWFDSHEAPVVMVRPDRFVAAGGHAQDASATVRRLAAALTLTDTQEKEKGDVDAARTGLHVAQPTA